MLYLGTYLKSSKLGRIVGLWEWNFLRKVLIRCSLFHDGSSVYQVINTGADQQHQRALVVHPTLVELVHLSGDGPSPQEVSISFI